MHSKNSREKFSIQLAVASVLVSVGGFAGAAEYGIGSTISSNTEIIFPILVDEGNWLVQPLITHRENESSTGKSQFTGLYVNTLKRIGSYEKVDVYAGLEVGKGNGDDSDYYVSGVLQSNQRTYSEILIKPNIEAVYSVSSNFKIGGQFGLALWEVQYDYDAYNPTPTNVPTEHSSATRAVIFVKYFFHN